MTIGQIAKAAGVSPSAIRFYESAGLLPKPPRKSGRRDYDDAVLEQLQVLRFFRSSGFSIRTLSEIFGENGRSGSAGRGDVVRRRIEELDEVIDQARAMRKRLHGVLACQCDGDKARCVIFA